LSQDRKGPDILQHKKTWKEMWSRKKKSDWKRGRVLPAEKLETQAFSEKEKKPSKNEGAMIEAQTSLNRGEKKKENVLSPRKSPLGSPNVSPIQKTELFTEEERDPEEKKGL